MAFHDVQFPTDISWGAVGGPTYKTDIVSLDSGHEARNANWSSSRGQWNVSHAIKTQAQLDVLVAFFRARLGRAHSFRYRDWTDYNATQQVLGQTGAPTVQLRRVYTSGPTTVYRVVVKPVAPITMRRNGGAFTTFTLDASTGIVSLTADSTIAITGITQANPGVVTTSGAHGLTNGDVIWIESVAGMTQVNNLVFTIGGASGSVFNLGVNTTTYTSYSSGGSAKKYVQPADVFDWTGTFDVHCRFDSDILPATLDAPGIYTWGDILVLEVRGT